MNKPKKINGGVHSDYRGKLEFVNSFDMSDVKRFYKVTHTKIDTIRAWQIHNLETKWFYCIKGGFKVKVVNLVSNEIENFKLFENEPVVLWIPPGNGNGFKALIPDSELIVFSDKLLVESKGDNQRLDVGSFGEIW